MNTQPKDRDIADELATFASGLSLEMIPEVAIQRAEWAITDTIGVTLAGQAEGAGKHARDALMAINTGEGESSIYGADGSLPVLDAVFLNATAGHGLDFDDVTWGVYHASVPMVAPLLAAAEHANADGSDVVAGYIAGFETQAYLAAVLLPSHYERGWHATATFGTFGTASAVSRVLGLSAAETRTALEIAASKPAGLKHNFGSMTKPMHAGHAARSGMTAALLAQHGFTASEGAMDDERGFCTLYNGDETPDLDDFPTLGERWSLTEEGVDVKKYPCCYFTHPSIAAAIDLRDEHDLSPEDIESVSVTTSRGAADALLYKDPDTGLEGKFSMEYTVAAALATGRVDLTTFDDENIDDPDVQAVRERIDFEVDHELPYDPFMTTVTIRTTDGEERTRIREKPPGTADNPLSEAEYRKKFELCNDRAPAAANSETVFERLTSLREQSSITDIVELL